MSDVSDYEITDAMVSHGGSFVNLLGHLYQRGDEINRARIRMAWPEYWEEYRELAALLKARANAATR